MKWNRTIHNLSVEKNFLKHKFLIEIDQACKRNKKVNVKKDLPNYQEEINQLIRVKDTKTNQNECLTEIKFLKKQRSFIKQEVMEGEVKLDGQMKVEEERCDVLKDEKKKN
jgi:hypothetical protein